MCTITVHQNKLQTVRLEREAKSVWRGFVVKSTTVKKTGLVDPERAAFWPSRFGGAAAFAAISKPLKNKGDSAKGGSFIAGLAPFSAAAAFIQYVIGERA